MGADIRITLSAFTVLAPAGALAFLLMAVLVIRQPRHEEWVERLTHWLVVPLTVCMVGLVASATHLGTPGNALYVLNGWGRSPLSNEVISALGFLVVAGAYWLASFSGKVPFTLNRIWLCVSCVMALWLVEKISVVYAIATIPTWNSELVPPGLWVMAGVTGPPVTLATLVLAQRMGVELPPQPWYTRTLLCCCALSLIAALAVYGIQDMELGQLRNALGTAAELVPWNRWAIAAFGALGASGLTVLAIPVLRERALSLPAALGAVTLTLTGAVFIRVAFYSFHMTL
ncbi:MAG: dimethyl sulfoxide reductase anchor subunit [Coriobacteriales bacterium]|jgi:anaerobic dimethyl sulfoxide reductase subunit C (anchor subunit)|nr:dimethyl sulfoxide reductase anchor subunit [Coriobacteriales bacterium]